MAKLISMRIQTLIGEATAYDKKQQIEAKRPKSWLKSVAAFANGEGGTLVFGINDDDQVVGLADAESDAERINEEIFKNIIIPIPPKHVQDTISNYLIEMEKEAFRLKCESIAQQEAANKIFIKELFLDL